MTTEAEFLRQVIQVAHLLRWETYHPALSKWSERGFPDLTIVRPPRIVFAELKSDKGKTTPHQEQWLAMLQACPGVEAFLWRPADFDTIVETLR